LKRETQENQNGAINKFTLLMKEGIQSLFDGNFGKIQEDLESLEAKDRLKFITDLMPYLMPKLQSTTTIKRLIWKAWKGRTWIF